MLHFTSVQMGDYISVMSDIVSFHSKRLEHLAIHFDIESFTCVVIHCTSLEL